MLKHLLFIFFVALLLRVGLIMSEEQLVLNSHGGDYPDYVTAAKHIQAEANFSHPFFARRPPLLPLMIYALDFNDQAVLYVNAVLGALTAGLTYILAQQLGLRDQLAQAAGLVVALDAASIFNSAFLGPEPSANLLLLVSIIALLATIKTPRFELVWGLGAGMALALSLLARPAIYLLWIPLGVWRLITQPRSWQSVVAFMLVSAIGMAGWIIHNGQVFDHYIISTIAPYNLLFYRAASVEHLATGKDIDAVYLELGQRVEQKLGRDPARVTRVPYQYLEADREESTAMQAVALEVFKAHPLTYLATFPIGFARMFGWTQHLKGGWGLLGIGWNSLFVGGTLAGLAFAYHRQHWLLFWCVLLICGYFTATTLLVLTSGMDTRIRSMLTPFMAVAFVYGAACFLEKMRTTRK